MHPFYDPSTTKRIHDMMIQEVLTGRRAGHETGPRARFTGVRKLTARMLVAIGRRIDPAPTLPRPTPLPVAEPRDTECRQAA